MKYAFDLDDTISDTAKVINKYAIKFDKEELNGKGILKESNNSKNYYYFTNGLNWSSKNIKDFFDKYYLEIISKVKIKPYVKETIEKLRQNNDKIYIITARRKRENDVIEKITSKWLLENGIYYDELFINVKEKADLVRKLNIDVFIDDSYENCSDVKKTTNADVYMIKTKYNSGIIDNSIKIIENISQIL